MFRTYEIPGVFDELDLEQPVLRYFNLVKFFDLIRLAVSTLQIPFL